MTGNEQTTIDRFRTISPDQFQQEIQRVWDAVGAVRECVSEQVQNESIPPLTGLGMIASVTAQAFGYGLFTNVPAPADLLATLSQGALAGNRS